MQAERSDVASGYDRFSCLRCDLVLSYRRPQGLPPTGKPDRGRG